MAKNATSFKPGNPGKPKGAKTKKSKEWEQLKDWLTTEGALRVIEELKTLKGIKFVSTWNDTMEYFEAKKQRVDITTDGESLNTTKVVFPNGNVKELPEATTEYLTPEQIKLLADEGNTGQE